MHEDNATLWFQSVQHTAEFRKSDSGLGKEIPRYSSVGVFLCERINVLGPPPAEMNHVVAVSSS